MGSVTLSRIWLGNIIIVIFALIYSAIRLGTSARKVFFLFGFGSVLYFFSQTSFYQKQQEGIFLRSEKEVQILLGERDIAQGMHGRVGRVQRTWDKFNKEYTFFERLVGTPIFIGPHGDYAFWLYWYGYIGIIFYIFFFFKLSKKCIENFNMVKNHTLLAALGIVSLAAIIVWLLTAVATNSSMIVDYGYFVLGTSSIFISFSDRYISEDYLE